MKKLNLSSICELPERKNETLQFVSLGIEVEVTEISAACMVACRDMIETLGDTNESNEAVELLMASCAITEDGNRPFDSDEGRKLLVERLPKMTIRQIATTAMRLSGIGESKKN